MPQKRIDFEINLTKMKWCPKHVSEVPETISRAFETTITMKQIQPVIGTDHVKQWLLKEDADIPEFYNAPTMMQEWIAEKVIKVKIPGGIMPVDFTPKKSKILAKGQRVAKFFGENDVSTRTVECSLKLFDCGHFYLKQTLPGSGASPHWTIFEGRWRATEKGVKLEYLLRYSWQLSRKPGMDFAIEAVRSELMTSLAWDGETEKQLNGNLPAIVGTEEFFWAEVVRDGDVKGEAKIRWNEDCQDPVTWVRKPAAAPRPAAQPQPAPPQPGSDSGEGEGQGPQQRRPAADAPRASAAAAPRAAAKPRAAPAAGAPRPPAARGAAALAEGKGLPVEEDSESPWPLYIGFGLFVAMAAAFVYSTWEERA